MSDNGIKIQPSLRHLVKQKRWQQRKRVLVYLYFLLILCTQGCTSGRRIFQYPNPSDCFVISSTNGMMVSQKHDGEHKTTIATTTCIFLSAWFSAEVGVSKSFNRNANLRKEFLHPPIHAVWSLTFVSFNFFLTAATQKRLYRTTTRANVYSFL